MKEQMMTKVVTTEGQRIPEGRLMSSLEGLNPNDMYKKQKAAGSIGGSVAHGYLAREGEQYVCLRDAKKLNVKPN